MGICWFWEAGCDVDFASWVQAIGSIAAIAAVGITAIYQSRKQHESALRVSEYERKIASDTLNIAVYQIVLAAAKAMRTASDLLDSRTTVHDIADGLKYFHKDMIATQVKNLEAIPLHSLPSDTTIRTVLMQTSLANQFHSKLELVFRNHRKMKAEDFQNFFIDLAQIATASEEIAKDIKPASHE